MLHLLREGDKVKVWPRPGLDVHLSPPTVLETPSGVQVLPGRLLDKDGVDVVWSSWLHEMARAGALFFSDPTGDKLRPAKHVRHPHEMVDGKPAHTLGARDEDELAHWTAIGHEGGKLAAKPADKAPAAKAKE